MATLQKFKLLATQCSTAANSPSRSPLPTSATKSPSFHLRRHRTTIRRFLGRSSSSSYSNRRFLQRRGEESDDVDRAATDRAERKGLLSHTSLKDLFVSSPSPPKPNPSEAGARVGSREAEGIGGVGGGLQEGVCAYRSPTAAGGGRAGGRRFALEGIGGAAFSGRRGGGGFSSRFGSAAGLRYRLLRRAWRPVLLTIPE